MMPFDHPQTHVSYDIPDDTAFGRAEDWSLSLVLPNKPTEPEPFQISTLGDHIAGIGSNALAATQCEDEISLGHGVPSAFLVHGNSLDFAFTHHNEAIDSGPLCNNPCEETLAAFLDDVTPVDDAIFAGYWTGESIPGTTDLWSADEFFPIENNLHKGNSNALSPYPLARQRNKRQRTSSPLSIVKGGTSQTRKRKKQTQHPRTRISQDCRSILEAHFRANHYPKEDDINFLAQQCKIPAKAVKTWFSNTRSRKDPTEFIEDLDESNAQKNASTHDMAPAHHTAILRAISVSSQQDFSESLLRTSPAPSTLSMERYLASPPEDEPASPAAIVENITTNIFPCQNTASSSDNIIRNSSAVVTQSNSVREPPHGTIHQTHYKETSDFTPSVAHSASSAASVASYGTSMSKSSRRGRKKWSYREISTNVSSHDATMTAHLSMKQALMKQALLGYVPDEDGTGFGQSDRCSISSQELGSCPATPQTTYGNNYNDIFKTSPDLRSTLTIPKFERTYTDVAADTFYDPHNMLSADEPAFTLATVGNRYSCTFSGCDQAFRQKYEWMRHENSVHLSQNVWICCRTDSGFADVKHFSVHGMSSCFLCGLDQPSYGHIIEQHFSTCSLKPEQERTFYRHNNLAQHIKHVHMKDASDVSVPRTLLDLWERKSPGPPFGHPLLRCGFCGLIHLTWKARQEHIATHIENGLEMTKWDYEGTTASCGDQTFMCG